MTSNNIEDIIKNIKNIPEVISKSKDILSNINVYSESGAGLVKVKLDGKKQVIKINIDSSLMKEEKFIIEDLVSLAINNASKKVDIEVNNKMTDLMQDMGIPKNLISILPFINSK